MLKSIMNFIIIKNGMVLVNSDSRNKPRVRCYINNLFACKVRLKLELPNFYGLVLAFASQFGGAPLASRHPCESTAKLQRCLLK